MYIARSYSSAGRRVWNTHGVASQLSAMTLKPASSSSGIRYSWVLSRRVLPVLTIQWISGTLPSASAQKPSPFMVQPPAVSASSAAAASNVPVKHRIAVRARSDRAAARAGADPARTGRRSARTRRPGRSTARSPGGTHRPRRRTNGSSSGTQSSSCWKYSASNWPPGSASNATFGSASSCVDAGEGLRVDEVHRAGLEQRRAVLGGHEHDAVRTARVRRRRSSGSARRRPARRSTVVIQ